MNDDTTQYPPPAPDAVARPGDVAHDSTPEAPSRVLLAFGDADAAKLAPGAEVPR